MTPEPPIVLKSSKRSQQLIRQAITNLREARRVEPDTDIKALYELTEEYLEGIITNLKAAE